MTLLRVQNKETKCPPAWYAFRRAGVVLRTPANLLTASGLFTFLPIQFHYMSITSELSFTAAALFLSRACTPSQKTGRYARAINARLLLPQIATLIHQAQAIGIGSKYFAHIIQKRAHFLKCAAHYFCKSGTQYFFVSEFMYQ